MYKDKVVKYKMMKLLKKKNCFVYCGPEHCDCVNGNLEELDMTFWRYKPTECECVLGVSVKDDYICDYCKQASQIIDRGQDPDDPKVRKEDREYWD